MQPLHNSLKKLIFSTIAYFDIFDFPVTKEEIRKYLHSSKKIKNIAPLLSDIPQKKIENTTFYFLPKRDEIVEKRVQKEQISRQKLTKVKNIIRFVGLLPTIAFVGISGSLAMKNGDEKSDIDLFIIALPHTVWLSRFVLWVLLSFTGKRRKRNATGENDICVNMIMDRDMLLFDSERRDVYTAHEIAQLVPVVDKYDTYQFFLHTNKWIFRYLANSGEDKPINDTFPWLLRVILFLIIPVEKISEYLQIAYMKGHKTIENTTSRFIAFHPVNYRDTILKEFEKRKKQYGI